MPKSRVRKPRRRSTRKQPHRRRVASVRPGQDVSHLLTDEDIELMRAEIDAGARGDALAAYHLHDSVPQVEGGLYPSMLRELVILGDDAPPWMYSRWCLDLAYRWMLIEQDTRIGDAVYQTMLMAHWSQVEPLLNDTTALGEYGNCIAADERLCEELALQEYGGIDDFIDVKAEAGLLDRCDHMVQWAVAEMGGYVIQDARGPMLRVLDLADDSELEVLNIGALSDRGRDVPIIGRLGPISSSPGLMFQRRPVAVDLETAQGVAKNEGPQDDWPLWVPSVTDGSHSGRLPSGFSCGMHTLYSRDILPMAREVLDRLDDREAAT